MRKEFFIASGLCQLQIGARTSEGRAIQFIARPFGCSAAPRARTDHLRAVRIRGGLKGTKGRTQRRGASRRVQTFQSADGTWKLVPPINEIGLGSSASGDTCGRNQRRRDLSMFRGAISRHIFRRPVGTHGGPQEGINSQLSDSIRRTHMVRHGSNRSTDVEVVR